ncbi:MAG: tail fiber domain-containing protein [Nitrospirota bacterium]
MDRIWITNTGNVGIGKVPGSTYQLDLSTASAAKVGGGLWSNPSDVRLKTDIQPYKRGLKEILQINPVNYKYNGKGGIGRYKIKKIDFFTGSEEEIDFVDTELLSKTFVGVIAQDVQPVLPDTVSSHKGKLNDYDKDETDLLDFDGSELIYLLINAVKELSAEVDSLNQQIADLKAQAK